MEEPSLEGGDLHRDSGVPYPLDTECDLLRYGAPNLEEAADRQSRREAEQEKDLEDDHRPPLHLLLLFHPLQCQPGFLRTGADENLKGLRGGISGSDDLSHRSVHCCVQLLFRPHRLLFHLRDNTKLP